MFKKDNEIKETAKTDKPKWLLPVIIAAIALVVIVIVVVLVVSSNKKGNSNTSTGTNTGDSSNVVTGSKVSDTKYSATELEKNITSSAVLAKDGTLVAFISNKNDVTVNIELEVEFYDANGNILGSADTGLDAVGAKNDIALGIDDFRIPKDWDNYKLFVDVEKSDYTNYNDKVSFTHNTNKNDVVVQVTNNSDEEIEEITVAVVFYSGDTVVGYRDDDEYHTKPGRSANFNFSGPYDNRYNDLKYDTYKVYVNRTANY